MRRLLSPAGASRIRDLESRRRGEDTGSGADGSEPSTAPAPLRRSGIHVRQVIIDNDDLGVDIHDVVEGVRAPSELRHGEAQSTKVDFNQLLLFWLLLGLKRDSVAFVAPFAMLVVINSKPMG